jgi:hypothetical protein
MDGPSGAASSQLARQENKRHARRNRLKTQQITAAIFFGT